MGRRMRLYWIAAVCNATALVGYAEAPRQPGDPAAVKVVAEPADAPVGAPLPQIVPTSAVGHILRQADAALREAEFLLARKSVFAARQAAERALGHLAEANDRVLDAASLPAASHIGELDRALLALRESGDFWGRLGPLRDDAIQQVIAGHQTEVLKEASQERLSARYAADVYLDCARESFVRALGKGPMACRSLAVLSGAYRMQAAETPTLADNYEMIAVCCLRAATTCDAANAEVANELGYLLLRRDLLDESRWALFRSLSAEPTPQAFQNLAEVHRRYGRSDLAARCLAAAGHMGPSSQSPARVQLVAPEELARFGSGMAPAVPHAPAAEPVAVGASAGAGEALEPGRVANTPWYQQLLR